ncbi:hypothetical protein WME76_05465 [Sorangium sp. So ce119]|uniref:hypothetical protein n=1 Tax=Sorangium sp. So ce119 TaxID=3133279 RepID=UPI003F5D88F8
MRRMTGLLSLILLAPLTAATWLGCHAIAGIEDRTYVDPGQEPEPTEVSEQCAAYCAAVMENCTAEHQVYSTVDTCHGVCALLEPGDPLEPVDNTVACRAHQAELAGRTGEVAVHCPPAGPGGAGVCGSNCESYCTLRAGACTAELDSHEQCVAMCAGLTDADMFDVIENHEGDTLQCRLVHVSSASVDPEEHCKHSSLMPVEPCVEPAGTEPDCEGFCQVVMTSCTAELAVYESEAQCLAVCGALPPGGVEDREENTVGCRKYHAYSAMLAPTAHCPHTGPGGDGHCGSADEPDTGLTGNCESYCMLLTTACSEYLGESFPDPATCESECTLLPGAARDSGYSVASAEEGGNTLACRLFHVSRALELADPEECLAAIGESPCQ